jgi:hypothetical protein
MADRITTPFRAAPTATEVIAGIDLTDPVSVATAVARRDRDHVGMDGAIGSRFAARSRISSRPRPRIQIWVPARSNGRCQVTTTTTRVCRQIVRSHPT